MLHLTLGMVGVHSVPGMSVLALCSLTQVVAELRDEPVREAHFVASM